MAGTQGQVEIVVRARDDASQVITAVSDSLSSLPEDINASSEASHSLSTQFEVLVGSATALVSTLASFFFPVQEAAQFERAMDEVGAISNATGDDLARLSTLAREMGSETEFSAQQAAEGLKYLAMAGLSVDEAYKALPSVLQLAQAGAVELGVAADIATNIMSGFQMKAEDLSRVNDVLVATFTSTNSNLTEIGESMKYVAPVASSFGVSFEETAAAVGLFHNAGLKGETAGTQLRAVLTRLVDPSKEAQAELDKLAGSIGESSFQAIDSTGNIQSLADILKFCEESGMTASQAMKIFGQEAGTGMLAMLSVGSEGLKTHTELLLASKGRTEEVSEMMRSNAVGAWRNFTSAVSEASISLGEIFLPAATSTLNVLSSLVNIVADFVKENQILVGTLTAVAGGFAAISSGIAAFKAGSVIVTTLFGGAFWSGFLTTITAIGSALASIPALIAGIATAIGAAALYELNDTFREWVDNIEIAGVKFGLWKKSLQADSAEIRTEYAKEIEAVQNLNTAIEMQGETHDRIAEAIKKIDNERKGRLEELNKAQEQAREKLEEHEKAYNQLVTEAEESLTELSTLSQSKIDEIWNDALSDKITASYDNAMNEILTSTDKFGDAQKAKIQQIELESGEARVNAITSSYERVDAIYDADLKRIEELERAKIDLSTVTGNEKVKLEEDLKIKVAEKSQETYEKKKDFYEKATQALKAELDKNLDKEKEIAEQIIGIQEQIKLTKMSGEEKIRELQRQTMTEQEVYNDKLKEYNELMSLGYKTAQTDGQGAIEIFNKAIGVADDLVIKGADGSKNITQAVYGVQRATDAIVQAQEGMLDTAQKAMVATQEHSKIVKQELSEVGVKNDEIKAKVEQGFKTKVEVETKEFDELVAKVEKQLVVKIQASTDFDEAYKAYSSFRQETDDLKNNAKIEIEVKNAEAIKNWFNEHAQAREKLKEKIVLDIEQSGNIDRVTQDLMKITDLNKEIAVPIEAKLLAGKEITETEQKILNVINKLKDADKEKAEVKVTADDQASPVIQKTKEKAENLAAIKPQITLTAQDKATPVIQQAEQKVDEFGRVKGSAEITLKDGTKIVLDAATREIHKFTDTKYQADLTAQDNATKIITPVLNAANKLNQTTETKAEAQDNATKILGMVVDAQKEVDGKKKLDIEVSITGEAKTRADEIVEAVNRIPASKQFSVDVSQIILNAIPAIDSLIERINDIPPSKTTIHTTIERVVKQESSESSESTTYARTGKRIPGYGGGDTVDAKLEPGEWVIRKEAVAKYGDDFMAQVNAAADIPKFAVGGVYSGDEAKKPNWFESRDLAFNGTGEFNNIDDEFKAFVDLTRAIQFAKDKFGNDTQGSGAFFQTFNMDSVKKKIQREEYPPDTAKVLSENIDKFEEMGGWDRWQVVKKRAWEGSGFKRWDDFAFGAWLEFTGAGESLANNMERREREAVAAKAAKQDASTSNLEPIAEIKHVKTPDLLKKRYNIGGSPNYMVNALVERGEWIIGKESASALGDDFMNKINTMQLPVRKQFGGRIGSVPQFADGGEVDTEFINLLDKYTNDTGSFNVGQYLKENFNKKLRDGYNFYFKNYNKLPKELKKQYDYVRLDFLPLLKEYDAFEKLYSVARQDPDSYNAIEDRGKGSKPIFDARKQFNTLWDKKSSAYNLPDPLNSFQFLWHQAPKVKFQTGGSVSSLVTSISSAMKRMQGGIIPNISKPSLPKLNLTNTNPATIKHAFTFNFGDKTVGEFTGDKASINDLISQLQQAQMLV